jgi:hypothetical protein
VADELDRRQVTTGMSTLFDVGLYAAALGAAAWSLATVLRACRRAGQA